MVAREFPTVGRRCEMETKERIAMNPNDTFDDEVQWKFQKQQQLKVVIILSLFSSVALMLGFA